MLFWLAVARVFTGRFEPARAAGRARESRVARQSGQGLFAPAFVCLRGWVDAELGRLDAAEADEEEALESALLSGNVQVDLLDVDRAQPDGAGARDGSRQRSSTARRPGTCSASSSTRRPGTRWPTPAWPPAIRRGRAPCWRSSAGFSPRCGRSIGSRPRRSRCASCSPSGRWRRPRPGRSASRPRAAVAGWCLRRDRRACRGRRPARPGSGATRGGGRAGRGPPRASEGNAPLWAGRCRTLAGTALVALRPRRRRARASCGRQPPSSTRGSVGLPRRGAPRAAPSRGPSASDIGLSPRRARQRRPAGNPDPTRARGGTAGGRRRRRTRRSPSQLHLSESTVEKHVSRVLAKLGLGSRAGIVRLLAEDAPPL